jgi:membrane-bound serine protease (ClpP class)
MSTLCSTLVPRLAALALLLAQVAVGEVWARAGASGPSPGSSAGELVVVAIERELTRGTLSLVGRALELAAERDAALVLELDTPGGEVELMRRLGAMLEQARGEHQTYSLAWVKNEAMSAGAFIALHCDAIAMRDGTRIGASTPILAGPMGVAPVEQKLVSALRAEFRAAAEANGYPSAIAEGMVDGDLVVSWVEVPGASGARAVTEDELATLRASTPGVRVLERVGTEGQPIALTAREAVRFGLAFEARNLDEVVVSMIPTLYLEAPAILRVEPTAAEWLAQVLGLIAPLLLIGGIAMLWLEFQAPGLGLPAALSAVCFGLLITGRYIAGLAGLEHLVMIVAGVLLIAVELFLFPGTLWAGVAGALLLLGGLILSATGEIEPFSVELDRYILLQEAFETAMWLLVAVVVSTMLGQLLPRTPFYSRLALAPTGAGDGFGDALGTRDDSRPRGDLVGREATALTPLRPVGHVRVAGQGILEFEAWAVGIPLETGARVRVIGIEGGRLRVEAMDDRSEESA